MTKAGLSKRGRLDNTTRHLHWFAAAFGVTASFACAGFLISNPIGAPQSKPFVASWDAVGHIPGLSGTTFKIAQKPAQTDQIVDANATSAQPVTWNEIETPGCLTVTTETGQKLSFRIKGYRAPTDAGHEAPMKVDLSVTACSQSSKQVVNAVFEPDASETVIKSTSAERNL